MGNVNADGIWTPDEGDTLEPDVWSAQMAESISQGLGARMKLQETRAGAALGTEAGTDITKNSVIIPVTVKSGTRYYLTNMTLSGGVLKATTAGLYLITLSAAAVETPSGQVPLRVSIYIGTAEESGRRFNTATTHLVAEDLTLAIMLEVGDTIYGRIKVEDNLSNTVPLHSSTLRATLMYATT